MTETITTILCIGLLSIYALLGVTFLIHSIADIFDNRRRAKREEEREKRDLEYHEKRMKDFKYYGRKIWHSSTKYTAWHWHCNAKFQKRKYCETPTLKEESLEETFVEVFNGLIADKDEIMENYRLCIDAVTDDSEYRRQLEELNNGCGEVQTLIRSLLMTYSRQDTSEDIHEKLKEYEERLDTMARLKQELDLKIAACASKRVQITGFLNELMKHDAPLAKFDPLVWQTVINFATVNRDCTITFTFRDGTEKTVPIKNGVRPYTKRNKPQEVDGNDG